VDVKRLLCMRPDGANDRRANRDVRHEVTIHHVDVDEVGARRFNCGDFGAELRGNQGGLVSAGPPADQS